MAHLKIVGRVVSRRSRDTIPFVMILLGAVALAASEGIEPTRSSDTMINDVWNKNAMVYCLSIGTFTTN
jgi:hypothetical protein